MKRIFLILTTALLSLPGLTYAQCATPTVLAVSKNLGSVTNYLVHYTSGLSGTYYIEYGTQGFVPGNDSIPGSGGTILTGNNNGMTFITLPTSFSPLHIYVRVFCSNSSWSSNSAPYLLSSTLAPSPLFIPIQLELGTTYSNGFNNPSFPPGIFDICNGGTPTGQEWRYRFDVNDDGYYNILQVVPIGMTIPNIGIKVLNGVSTQSSL